jgi:hypothetical protein
MVMDPELDPTTTMMAGGAPPQADPALVGALSAQTPQGDQVYRDKPEPDEKRKKLVHAICRMVKSGKMEWEKTFDRMEKDQKFASGKGQWPQERKVEAFNDDKDDLYTANITLRHITQKVATTYAKNPKSVAKKRPKMIATTWDGTLQTLVQAQALVQQATQAQQMIQAGVMIGLASAATGVPISAIPTAMTTMAGGPAGPNLGGGPAGPANPVPPGGAPPASGTPPGAPGAPMPGPPPGAGGAPAAGGLPMSPIIPGMPQMPDPEAVAEAHAIIQDAQLVKMSEQQLTRMGRTLQILYDYEISEQQQPFKTMMKMTIRRALTTGVGWVKLGFQRIMQPSPDKDSRIADIQSQMELIERISADLADNEEDPDSAAAEEMRLTMQAIAAEPDKVVREGLQFSWPKSTAIIPDPHVVNLRGFLGAAWVAEEYCLSPNEVQETYGCDVSKGGYTAYDRKDSGSDYERAYSTWQYGLATPDDEHISTGDGKSVLVWELYNHKDGLIYEVCDGYCDFLREPHAPEAYTDRFWPWFLIAFNETDGSVYPPSDVQLMRHMQLEYNRSRQGLREHRFANRPKTAYAEGALSEEDLVAFQEHPVNATIAVSGLQPGQDINQVIMAIKGVPVDPNLYEVNPIFQDMLRVVGDQQSDLGGQAGNTATEANIAQAAKSSAMGSSVDDIDDTLTEIARAASQILLLNVSEETVKEIVGPGAVWPSLTKAQVAKDLWLDIEAGSSGKPNQAQELQNFERLAPILMQLPGVTPTWMAKQAITRLDDGIDIDEAIADGAPSILAMNGAKPGASVGPGAPDPNAQGPRGAQGPAGPAPPAPNSQAPSAIRPGTPPPPGLPN